MKKEELEKIYELPKNAEPIVPFPDKLDQFTKDVWKQGYKKAILDVIELFIPSKKND